MDYRITDSGPGAAQETKVTGATASNSVYPTTAMPLPLGTINQGSYAPFTIKYYIPSGVTGFQTTVYFTCKNASGSEFYYPETRSDLVQLFWTAFQESFSTHGGASIGKRTRRKLGQFRPIYNPGSRRAGK